MSKRKKKNRPHPRKVELARSQKRRQWEFFVLRDRRDAVMKLLRFAEATHNQQRLLELKQELEALELRGAKILEEQMQFLTR